MAQVDEDDVVHRLSGLLERLHKRRNVHHAAIGAADLDGSWSWMGAAGEAEPGRMMEPATPWFLASVTKLHIAVVVLRLHENGQIDLAAPVREQMPPHLADGLHIYDGADYTDQITPAHLLGHLSGLPDYLDEPPPGTISLLDEVLAGDRGWSAADAVSRARDVLEPHFPPSDPAASRQKIRYSDTNFRLLEVIAEHQTSESMASLYRMHIFEPLGLRHTWLPGDEPPDPPGSPADFWLGNHSVRDRPQAMRSFGDLYSTTADLLRFGRGLFSGEVFDDAATAGLMSRRFNRFGFPRGMASLRAPSWPIEYGLGMMRFALSRFLTAGIRIPGLIGHTGSTGSWLWSAPDLGLVIAGTVDQAAAATVPFRQVPRALGGLG